MKILIWVSVVCVLLLGCKTTATSSKATEKETVDYFADNGFGNAVAVVQHPAGIYHKGVTYVCYQGPLEDPYVASYHHETGEWKGPFKAGTSEMGKEANRRKHIDNHGKPSILIDDADYIHITFGGHGGMAKHGDNPLGNHHYGRNMHVVSKNPLDISSWETLDNIPPFGTYNQFVKMDNGDLFLFYRHGAHRSDWVYQKSTDNGRTFGQPVSFLKHQRRTDMPAVDSWYPWIRKGNGDELLVVYDYHICSDSNPLGTEAGHIPKRYNIYYMVFNTKTGSWKNVKGESLKIPLTRTMAEANTLVATTEGNWTFQGVVDIDSVGNPHIGMTVGEEIKGSRRSAKKQMQYYKWNGTQWLHAATSGLPIGNGDIEVLSPENIRFYIAEETEDKEGEVCRWDSVDGGKTFKRSKVYLSRAAAHFAISSRIENAHPNARLIVAERKSDTDYRKMYLLGDNGPIGRNSTDAQVLSVKEIKSR